MGIPNRSVFTLSSNQIKGLAAILMVVDHVGVVFFPQTQLLRYLGRLSFPLFCWLIAQGEQRTRNVYRYGLRLLVFGLISQPIYAALFETWQLNVLFTLLVGLVTLRVGRELPQVKLLVWMLGVLVATAISMDGGGYGVVIVLLMAHPLTLRWWAVWIVMHGLLAASEQIR
ncbi:MAG: TraX family protein, partial [Elainellaceae cyanobacterium]